MKKIFTWFWGYKNTLIYILLILLLNTLFAKIPLINLFGSEVSPMDPAVGIVYVLRDFAQREIGHRVIIAMLIGSILSYVLADATVAIASIAAFTIAEFIDWAVYTFTKKPLAQRILLSSAISSPIDSLVFLYILHQLNWLGFILVTFAKIFGVFVVWYIWRVRANSNQNKSAMAAIP